jgi:hypothetical protein
MGAVHIGTSGWHYKHCNREGGLVIVEIKVDRAQNARDLKRMLE